MENTENVAHPSTPSPKKKNYGAIFIVVVLIAAIGWFGGRHLYRLYKPVAVIDSVIAVDSAKVVNAVDSIKPLVDTVKVAGDTIKKVK